MPDLPPDRPGPRRQSLRFGAVAALSILSLSSLTTCVGDRGAEQIPDNEDPKLTLVSLTLTPNNDVLLVDLNKEETKAFKVRALFSDGSSADWTRHAQWRLDNPTVGNFSGSAFKSAVLSRNKVDFTKIFASVNDGVRERLAVANLTVVWLRASGSSQDFFFNLPFKTEPQTKPLTFSTEVQSLDVFLAVDTTGSMSGEITQLTQSLNRTVIPKVKAAAARDAWFGVGAIDDWPTGNYGDPGCHSGPDDQPLIVLQTMTDDESKAKQGVQQLMWGRAPRGCGADVPEGYMEALHHIATGDGLMDAGANIPPNHKGIGGVEFRDGALPVAVTIGDASFHSKQDKGEFANRTCYGAPVDWGPDVEAFAHTRDEVSAALNKICAKVVGVSALLSGDASCLATKDLTYFAKETGAIVPPEAWDFPRRPVNCDLGKCCTGVLGAGEEPDANGLCPLVFKITPDGSGIGDQVVSGITQLARFASFDVTTDIAGETKGEKGEPLPTGKTTADFIKKLLPLDAVPPPFFPPPVVTEKGFSKVMPGSVVRFNVTAHNELVSEAFQPQVFHATIRVRAGGCANLDSRDVIILIPPTSPTPG